MDGHALSCSSPTIADGEEGGASLTRGLSMRFDNIKVQYQHELIPLTERREALLREIAELKASRDAFLEETTVLNKRNEELAQLNAQYQRRVEAAPSADGAKDDNAGGGGGGGTGGVLQERQTNSFDRARSPPMLNSSLSSTTLALSDESAETTKVVKVPRASTEAEPAQQARPRFKWPGSRGAAAPKENVALVNGAGVGMGTDGKPKWRREHVFQQISVLRVARCDHCGDKMWGSQLKCTSESSAFPPLAVRWRLISVCERADCSVAVHTRCIHSVNLVCSQQALPARDEAAVPIAPLRECPVLHPQNNSASLLTWLFLTAAAPSMFGRDLIEQVRADSRDDHRFVPVIVEKCIDAVDNIGTAVDSGPGPLALMNVPGLQPWNTRASTARRAARASPR